ncbi:MAG TPA: DUF4190 domain-containing protein [Actinomycetota bacterium]|nr:DUF4190 domain-containing protein [Actinomycetota bacterium]
MTDQTTPAGGADTKRCPICAEQVKAAALICRYCGHDFRTDVAGAPPGGGPTPVAGSSPAQQAAAPWQAPAAGQAPGWGQWGTAPGVQTAGSLPGPSNVPGTGYPVAPSHTTNGYAIASMVLGILWVWWLGSVLALVFGYVAKGQIDRSNGMESGRGMAIAGIILGWVGIGVLVVAIIGLAVGRSHGSGY